MSAAREAHQMLNTVDVQHDLTATQQIAVAAVYADLAKAEALHGLAVALHDLNRTIRTELEA